MMLTWGYAYDGQLGHNARPNRLVLTLNRCVTLFECACACVSECKRDNVSMFESERERKSVCT